ncbi:MAG: DapH/DapD/GlmU-related protein [Leeuwenhoekiella sp.]
MWHKLIKNYRIFKYRILSGKPDISGKAIRHQPVLFNGKGKIAIGDNVHLGVYNAPSFYSTYAYIEARGFEDSVLFGSNIHINNNFSAIAFNGKITFEDDVLIGANCSITTSDFHNLDPLSRKQNLINGSEVLICKNAFIGDNVTILKGVTIGENSVIGSNSVVTKNIPQNSIAAGNPARVIRDF